jgi:hypothetical protein
MSAPRLINSKPSSQDIMLTEREESNSATPPLAKVKRKQNISKFTNKSPCLLLSN